MTGTTRKVLLTDDGNDYFGKSCASSLRNIGYDVKIIAKDGNEVLKQLGQDTPDVLIMDVFMTHVDALGVLKELSSMQLLRRPVIMLLSNVSSERFQQEAMNSGADYYFIKPFDVRCLAERVRQLNDWKGTAPRNLSYHPDTAAEPQDLEILVCEKLKQVGVPAHIKGYKYIRASIMLLTEKPNLLGSITKELYPQVAVEFETTPSRVERAIRHAIEVGWDRGDPRVIEEFFGYTVKTDKGKPTNSEFIAMIAENIRLRRKIA
jgi:two-component system response regulator (stage 0 sporulation protein A)